MVIFTNKYFSVTVMMNITFAMAPFRDRKFPQPYLQTKKLSLPYS
jgi:hypothetical protein